MLTRVSRSVTSRAALKRSTRSLTAGAIRNYVQPSGADRANVVDIPANFQDDGHFAPRPGMLASCILALRVPLITLLVE